MTLRHLCYKPIRVGNCWNSNCWNSNYIDYERNGDRNGNLSVKEYLNEIKPYLRDVITDLQKSGMWEVHLARAINFIFSKDVDRRACNAIE